MPVLDGYGVLRELRADPNTHKLPCIALTAFAGEHDRQRALEAGFDAYIAKPYQSQDLLQTIEDMLRNDNGADTNGVSDEFKTAPEYSLNNISDNTHVTD